MDAFEGTACALQQGCLGYQRRHGVEFGLSTHSFTPPIKFIVYTPDLSFTGPTLLPTFEVSLPLLSGLISLLLLSQSRLLFRNPMFTAAAQTSNTLQILSSAHCARKFVCGYYYYYYWLRALLFTMFMLISVRFSRRS
jgi:hypothetical protein